MTADRKHGERASGESGVTQARPASRSHREVLHVDIPHREASITVSSRRQPWRPGSRQLLDAGVVQNAADCEARTEGSHTPVVALQDQQALVELQ